MEAGVQCPADVKRRLARTQQKLNGLNPNAKSKEGGAFEKVSEEEEIPVPELENSAEIKANTDIKPTAVEQEKILASIPSA